MCTYMYVCAYLYISLYDIHVYDILIRTWHAWHRKLCIWILTLNTLIRMYVYTYTYHMYISNTCIHTHFIHIDLFICIHVFDIYIHVYTRIYVSMYVYTNAMYIYVWHICINMIYNTQDAGYPLQWDLGSEYSDTQVCLVYIMYEIYDISEMDIWMQWNLG